MGGTRGSVLGSPRPLHLTPQAGGHLLDFLPEQALAVFTGGLQEIAGTRNKGGNQIRWGGSGDPGSHAPSNLVVLPCRYLGESLVHPCRATQDLSHLSTGS